MSAKYYITLTNYGAGLMAQAHEQNTITLTDMVVGDANGVPYNPIDQKGLTKLVNQKAKFPIQSIEALDNIIRVTATLETHIGGFNVHEIGLIDNNGKLVYLGNYHGAYKPLLDEGSGGDLEIIIDIQVNPNANILIQVNPNIVTANKEWVLTHFAEKEQNNLDHANFRLAIEQLKNTYPRIIASGVSLGSNSFEIDLSDKIDDLRDNKYVIQITPEGAHEAWSLQRLAQSIKINMWNRSGTNRIGYSGNVNWSVIQSSVDSSNNNNGDYSVPGSYQISILAGETKQFILVAAGGAGGGSVWEDGNSANGGAGGDTSLALDSAFLVIAGGGEGGISGQWSNGSSLKDGEAGIAVINTLNADERLTVLENTVGNDGSAFSAINHSGGISVSPISNWGAGGKGANGVGDNGRGYGGGGASGSTLTCQFKNTSTATIFMTLIIGEAGLISLSNGQQGEDGTHGFARVLTV